jgi:DNA-binding transcriptional MerR regulator
MQDKRIVITSAGVRLSEVARLFGVSPRTILRLEEDGRIDPVPRSQSGQRRFTERHLRQIPMHCQKAALMAETMDLLIVPPKKATTLSITEVAKQFSTHVRTIQKLEAEGKISPVARDSRGNRRYRPEDVARIRKLYFGGTPADAAHPPPPNRKRRR